jgi:hypothetical protein
VTTRNDKQPVERRRVGAPRAGEGDREPTDVAELIASIMDPIGGVDLDVSPRAPAGPLPTFRAQPDEEERA